MAMGLVQQAPMLTESVDWTVEHLLRGLSKLLTPCLTHLRIIQGHSLTGCEGEPFGVCVKPEAWWEMGAGQKGLKRGLLGLGAGN